MSSIFVLYPIKLLGLFTAVITKEFFCLIGLFFRIFNARLKLFPSLLFKFIKPYNVPFQPPQLRSKLDRSDIGTCPSRQSKK